MRQITVMIKPASSLCNMRCKYCFYADVSARRQTPSFGVMKPELTQKIVDNILADLEPGDTLTLAFQGGEPTLAGLDYFEHITAYLTRSCRSGITVRYALQTNGYTLNESWCAFLKSHHFLVGLSLDADAALHNANRLNTLGSGTFSRVLESKRLLEQSGIDYNVLMALTREFARHPQRVWNFIQKEHIRYVQFIPCLGEMNGSRTQYSLQPALFASFYNTLFDLWYSEFCSGHYVSVNLFDNLIQLLATGKCGACGLIGACQPQIVVESDGSVYPCDFYATDPYKLGNLAESRLRLLFESANMSAFLNRPKQSDVLCETCTYRSICGGGCARVFREVCCQTENNGFCGYRLFLEHTLPRIQHIALQMSFRV